MKPYRPSNGTEGMYFMAKFCDQCIHENPSPDFTPKCDIITDTMILSIGDPGYPKEWCYDDNDKPCCTKFHKWDWNTDGDPNDPDNPKAPIPEDPNQLCLPFIHSDIDSAFIELPVLNLAL